MVTVFLDTGDAVLVKETIRIWKLDVELEG